LMSKKKISGDALLYAVGRQGNVEELVDRFPNNVAIRPVVG
jgi:hypothetical protein